MTTQNVCRPNNHSRQVIASIWKKKMSRFVRIKHFMIQGRTCLGPHPQPRINRRNEIRHSFIGIRSIRLNTQKGTGVNDIVHIRNDLNVSVEVKSALFVQDLVASIITYESPLLRVIRLRYIVAATNIKVRLIPTLNIVVGQEALPTLDATRLLFTKRISAKPAVMNYMRDITHSNQSIHIIGHPLTERQYTLNSYIHRRHIVESYPETRSQPDPLFYKEQPLKERSFLPSDEVFLEARIKSKTRLAGFDYMLKAFALRAKAFSTTTLHSSMNQHRT